MSATDDIHRFLESLEVAPRSRYSYVTSLRAFRALCSQREPSIDTVREWLKRDAARSPLPAVVARVAVIGRYLNWRAAHGAGPNPIAELKAQYGGRLRPIVCAVLKDNYSSALEALRPLPEWGSVQGPLIREHIARMRSLGYKYEVRARDLRRFDRYLQRYRELADQPLEAQLAAWRRTLRTPRHELRVEQCARTLTQALHRKDLNLPIVAITRGLQRRVERAERKPHLFTAVEIQRLYQAARTFPGRDTPHRPLMVEAMLTLAYCAGLRLGEIAGLTLADVDRDDRLIEIRDTKFFKSRRLPLAPGVMQVLERYLAARQAARAPRVPEAPLWWSPLRRKGYSYGEIQKLLTRVIRRAGLKPARGRRGPHVHDLRHAFVAHRMLKWYRDGVDPQSRLPHLATYLGHKDILSTLVYLNITPELLQQASERYRRRGAAALGAGDQP
jgi:integrase/recombinase XerD